MPRSSEASKYTHKPLFSLPQPPPWCMHTGGPAAAMLMFKGRPPKTWHLFIKYCVFILTCLNFSHLQSTLHLMQYTYRDIFPLLKTVLNLLILIPFRASAIFCFTSSTSAKCFPLRTFFICENEQTNTNVTWGQIGWIGKVGHVHQYVFGQKTDEQSDWCGQVHSQVTHHEMKESSKRFTEV